MYYLQQNNPMMSPMQPTLSQRGAPTLIPTHTRPAFVQNRDDWMRTQPIIIKKEQDRLNIQREVERKEVVTY